MSKMKKSVSRRRQMLLLLMAMLMAGTFVPGMVPESFAGAQGSLTADSASEPCGENLTWKLDEATGTLTISGTGAMFDFGNDLHEWAPWTDIQKDIKSVIMNPGITNVGASAFEGCTNLESIKIPDEVTTIGFAAFRNCVSLKSIALSENVDNIETYAFRGCTALESISVAGSNEVYRSIDGVLFAPSEKALVVYPAGKKETDYVIPHDVSRIGNEAFQTCRYLERVTIPDTVEEAGEYAFEDCKKLSSVQIFLDARSVIVYENGEPVTKTAYVGGIRQISAGMFKGCASLTDIVLPEGIHTIKNYAFEGCSSLKEVKIPATAKTLGDSLFSDCNSLERIVVEAGNENYKSSDGVLFNADGTTLIRYPAGKKDARYVIPDGVERMESFAGNIYLNKVIIPESVTRLEGRTFSGCQSLQSIDLPEKLTLGYDCFSGCQALEAINAAASSENYKSIDGVLFSRDGKELLQYPPGKKDENYDIPVGVETIGYDAFGGCANLVNLTIPESTEDISGDYCFYECKKLKSITVKEGNESYQSMDGVLYFHSPYYTGLVRYPEGRTDTTYTIPEEIDDVGDSGFDGCENLKILAIQNPDCYVNSFSFSGCSNLRDIYYAGTEQQWEEIIMDVMDVANLENDLKDVTIHCMYQPVDVKFDLKSADTKISDGSVFALGDQFAEAEADGMPVTYEYDGQRYASLHALSEQIQVSEAGVYRVTAIAADENRFGAATADFEITPGNVYENPFADVSADAYYFNPVRWALENGVTQGTSDTTFSPDADCTRAQMVTFLWRAKGKPEPASTENPFTDVKDGEYYTKAVLWAVEQGITNGTSKTTFGPGDTVLRAQTATFLWRMEGKEEVATENPFVDVAADTYYTKAVLWAAKNAITKGTSETTFAPVNPCTRGQIVTFLYRDLAEESAEK